MRLLVGYDCSDAARAAIATSGALFPAAETLLAFVQPPPPTLEVGALARVPLPESVLLEGIEGIRAKDAERARETTAEAMELARAGGLRASTEVLSGVTPWRTLRAEARRRGSDVLVCGTRGDGPVGRVLLGSTASSLLHHADCPLLLVPAEAVTLDGPVLAGYDDSDGARRALRFAARHLAARPVTVAHAWRSPVQHTLRGQALLHSHLGKLEDYAETLDTIWREIAEETAEGGAAYARDLGLRAQAGAPESGRADWQALLDGARDAGATLALVGSRGRSAVASTVLGSVASALVHAAALPVLVVPATYAGR